MISFLRQKNSKLPFIFKGEVILRQDVFSLLEEFKAISPASIFHLYRENVGKVPQADLRHRALRIREVAATADPAGS